ncbi:MAG: hypothetical protein A2X08_03110 [Bacteroidetes bacterium GWA2_32_17]|nr:MAG: hypothetical protein A2X08_03110 [Bacteroidetes bacterium GWA2_32_17]
MEIKSAMLKKGKLILEYVWLILAIVAVIIGSYKVIYIGFNQSYIFYIIAAIACFMYMLRRAMRKFLENNKK